MMYGWGSNWGMGLTMLLSWIMPLVFIGILIYGVTQFLGRNHRAGSAGPPRSTAIELLRERYARGEVSSEDFRRMKKELEE